MADVFISYSRRDSGYVKTLADDLAEHGKSVWLDTEGIADGEVFPLALQKAIETSSGFVFVISPESAKSPYCAQEVELALQLNKRIVPVVHETVPDDALPEGIRVRNWIPGDDPAHVDRIATALDHDLDHVQAHTRWGLKALEWDQRDHDKSLLLRGAELTAAEAWLAGASGKDPEPTDLQRDYVRAAFAAARRRQRLFTGVSIAVAALSVMLVVYALVSRGQAREQRRQAVSARITARSQALAATATANLASAPQVALALATRAVRLRAIPQSLYSLRAALDAVLPLQQFSAPPGQAKRCAKQGNENVPVTTALTRPGHPQLTEFGCDGSIRVHDAGTGAIVRRVPAGDAILSSAYSPDGATLAVASRSTVTVRDADTLAVRQRLTIAKPRAGSTAISFASDHQILETVYGGHASWATVREADIETGRTTELLSQPIATDSVIQGEHILVGTNRASVIVFDARTHRRLHELRTDGQHDYLTYMGPSPDGRLLAVGIATRQAAGQVDLYDARSFRHLRTVANLPNVSVNALTFSPDSLRLAFAGYDGTSQVYDVAENRKLVSFSGRGSFVAAITFSADGARVTTSDVKGTIRTFRAQGQQETSVPGGFEPAAQIGSVSLGDDTLTAIGPAPRRAAVVRRWTLPSGKPAGSLTLPPGSYPGAFNTTSPIINDQATLSGDGRVVLLAARDGSLRLVSAADAHTLGRLPRVLYGIATIAPDDRTVVIAGGQRSANASPLPGVIVRPGAAKPVPLETPKARQADWRKSSGNTDVSADGRVYAQVFEGSQHATAWDLRTGALLRSVSVAGAVDVALDDVDGVMAVGASDGNTTLISLRTGRRMRTLTATASISTLAYGRDGRRLVTLTSDHVAHVWDPAAGRELRRYKLPTGPLRLSVSSSGSRFAVSGTDGVVRVYDTCTACEDGPALLRLAGQRPPARLTPSEQAAVDAA